MSRSLSIKGRHPLTCLRVSCVPYKRGPVLGQSISLAVVNGFRWCCASTWSVTIVAVCSDLSHHLMGRWHYEMAQLNRIVRTLIRVAFSTDLPPGTIQDALSCYQQAAKLNPGCVAHQVEIGRCLSRLGRRADAMEALEVC